MSTNTTTPDEIKVKHRALWAAGDYPAVATQVIADLGPTLVRAVGIRDGERVLDVAAGSGNAAIPAAETGAEVVASDLTPELFTAGRQLAAERQVELVWQEGDVEALPYENDTFDVVISCVGAMFAPHHQTSADEIVRVCRSGGRIGLINWTPQGFIGQMFATMKPYAPPPPPGAQPPPLWGDEDHVRALFGDRIAEVTAAKQTLKVDRFETPEEFRDFFKATYGPTIAVYKANAENPDATAALDTGLADLAGKALNDDGVMEWEYLVVTAVVR